MIEVEPEFKRRLYAALAMSGSTLKDWFLKAASTFCEESIQPSLFPRDQDLHRLPKPGRKPTPKPLPRLKNK